MDRKTTYWGMLPFDNADKLEKLNTSISISSMDDVDAPLVYVNRAFERLTGYEYDECVGKNCRFLQGQGTNRKSLRLISQAVEDRTTIEVCVLNYRRNGEPFHNLLVLSPFQTSDGKDWFLGCQYELKLKLLRVEQHLEAVAGVVRLLTPHGNDPWAQTMDAIRMRSHAVSALVRAYTSQQENSYG